MEPTLNDDQNIQKKSDDNSTPRKIDFEKYIEESLEDADLFMDDEMDKEKLEAVKKTQSNRPESIHASAKQIADIISQNELIEQAKQERVRAILDKQIRIYERKSDIMERLDAEMSILKTKQKVALAARKKAKGLKLNKKVVALIKNDLAYIDEAMGRCNEMIKTERKDLMKIGSLINLLDSAS